MPSEITTPRFVLRTRPYGESDRIVTLITETHGKVTGIAKGAKNSRRRFAGTLEPFVRIRARLSRSARHSDLAFLLRCELLGHSAASPSDLDRFAAGSYVLELTDRMVHGREPGARGLRAGARGPAAARPRASTVDPAAAGLRAPPARRERATRPTLDRCRGCGRPDPPTLYLAVAAGRTRLPGLPAADERVGPVRRAHGSESPGSPAAASPLADASRATLAEATTWPSS